MSRNEGFIEITVILDRLRASQKIFKYYFKLKNEYIALKRVKNSDFIILVTCPWPRGILPWVMDIKPNPNTKLKENQMKSSDCKNYLCFYNGGE